MASFAIFMRVLLALNGAAPPHRRLRLPLRRRLLRDSAILIVLGASALFHAVADPSHALAAAGFLAWVSGVVLLLLALTVDRFPAAARLAAQLVEAAVAAAL
ncbi:hypothetical protein BS78_10G228100 [Paspalum vaginatum]|uniref:Uncharacterized protein n=1 Tax=Paspalum vaginatum TaxID=158149 RepID=A0A9W7X8Q9_9POAL|nr:hypothetical protein BS78_K111600 [Paspalum vaginatum]KAJ1260387.1 hypothetical protein BS78_10G228100 [Paspalum vaginatum]